MPVATRVSVSEYLNTSYRPDCDYLDGEVVERNVGERDHARSQALAVILLGAQEKQWGITVLPEQRVQVRADRYRIPDVCVLAPGAPREQIVTHPPFLCIEVLSSEDSMSRTLDRIEDYLAMGVPHVWLIDPWRRHGYHYTRDGMQEVKDGVLRTSNPDLSVALAALFE
jgi:Uma2 family endonuclease